MSTEQTPVKEDLTAESTTFDLDWAKCGGVWLLKGKGLQKDYFFVGYVEIENRIYMTNAANGDGESLLKKDLAHVRMATRAECDAAGIEYIDRPNTSAKNTDPYTPANAVPPKTDTERLEHCFKYFIGRMGQKANINPAGTWYDSPREAIDAAMAAGKGGE